MSSLGAGTNRDEQIAANSPYEQALNAITVAESKGLLPVGTYQALREGLAEAEKVKHGRHGS